MRVTMMCHALAASLILVRPGTAVQYYVSSSDPVANDGNPGTSSSAPWRTLQRVSQVRIEAGDSVLLRAGDVWNETVPVFWENWRGTAQVPILLTSYKPAGAGTGAADGNNSVDRPHIMRSNASDARGPIILLNDSAGIQFRGLELSGGEQGLALFYHVPGLYDSIDIQDCYFHEIAGVDYVSNSGSWWGAAIAFGALYSGVELTHVNVSNNLANHSDTFYINSLPWNVTTRAYVSGMVMGANTLTHMNFNTVFMDTTDNFRLVNNVFMHNTPDALFTAGTTDVIMGTLNSSCVLSGNEIGWRGEFPGGPDGCAIDFETNANGVAVVDNYIHRSWGAGIMVFGHETTSTNIVIANNTFLFDGCNQTKSDHGGIAFMHANASGLIADNVFATCMGTPVFFELVPGAMDGFLFENNTIAGPGSPVLVTEMPLYSIQYLKGSGGGGDSIVVTATPVTPGSTIRYTLDGSKPTSTSMEFPALGNLTLPARTTAVNLKAFMSEGGWIESPCTGEIVSPAATTGFVATGSWVPV